MSRGASQEALDSVGVRSWIPLEESSPDKTFRKRFGSKGEKLNGVLIFPFWSPLGELLGFEARGFPEKWISDYRLRPDTRWLPIWISDKDAAEKLWKTGRCWLVEGSFDVFAMKWVVPPDEPIYGCVTAGLSFTQTRFLNRFAEHINTVFDRDDAGRKATRNTEKKFSFGTIKVDDIEYRGGKDPGEIWEAGGMDALIRAFPDVYAYRLSKEESEDGY